MDWQRLVGRMAAEVEGRVDRTREVIRDRVGVERTVRVVPYRGYGTPSRVFIRGRVLYGGMPGPATADDRWWDNLVNTYRRIESDEVPGARVRVHFQGVTAEARADEEGHFGVELHPDASLPPDRFWHDARIELVDPPGRETVAPVAVPLSPRFGVISDLDDTVLKTDVRNLLRMAREVLFGNAHTRIPFAGVGAFYRALHIAGTNPLFYVSSSPWNLYDLLSEFLQLHRIPAGPMDLRDWGISVEGGLPIGHHTHKRAAIDRILATYPGTPFILVGDSGQEDPEIYRDVVHDHPDRILGIYIRSVIPDPTRIEAVRSLTEELASKKIDLVLADDTLAAARHAAAQGWIPPEAIDEVARDRRKEEAEAAT
jgi:phosphatidate phosphatase APP1